MPLMILLFALPAISRSSHPDSLYFVRLRDGSTHYGNKVKWVNSSSKGKYLLLDGNRQIPLSQATSFRIVRDLRRR
jgi:hypothetical protein